MLTKDQVAKLSVEQQETLAGVEISRVERRQLLLNEMRGLDKPWSVGWMIVASWLLVFAFVYFLLQTVESTRESIAFALVAVSVVNVVAMSYTLLIRRRLNALIKILEENGQFDFATKHPPNHDDQKP